MGGGGLEGGLRNSHFLLINGLFIRNIFKLPVPHVLSCQGPLHFFFPYKEYG